MGRIKQTYLKRAAMEIYRTHKEELADNFNRRLSDKICEKDAEKRSKRHRQQSGKCESGKCSGSSTTGNKE
ncbi:MAG: hypothetical protein CVT88_10610 [Candidatus Altiarchaeales archaeon HGW-Altiarchaeales-1]|nr:MAG: hypothetical protein CVT88_10610 [Candidatus Altiarchaeales archaeon HGW-Altiarchaeales-1]